MCVFKTFALDAEQIAIKTALVTAFIPSMWNDIPMSSTLISFTSSVRAVSPQPFAGQRFALQG